MFRLISSSHKSPRICTVSISPTIFEFGVGSSRDNVLMTEGTKGAIKGGRSRVKHLHVLPLVSPSHPLAVKG